MRIFLVVFLCAFANTALAGAWQRTPGEWFAASAVNWGLAGSRSTSFYAEYGVFPRLTMGIDGWVSDRGALSVLAFARIPLWRSEGGHRIAVEFAGGTQAGQSHLQSSLSYGRGLEYDWMSGWVAIDAKTAINLETGAPSFKLDSTLGVRANDRWTFMMQSLSAYDPEQHPVLKLAPSVLRRIGRGTHVELGVVETVLGGQGTALKLGLWLEF
jgi:hypothetical protein